MLSGIEIQNKIAKSIIIDPFDPDCINPNSYDLKLHNELYLLKGPLDVKEECHFERIIIPNDGFILEPNNFYLGRSVEYTESDSYIPILFSKSSIARLGISIIDNSGFGNIGFHGCWTLEISCIMPVKIYPLIRICQIAYFEVTGDYKRYENGLYQNNKAIQTSLMFKELK